MGVNNFVESQNHRYGRNTCANEEKPGKQQHHLDMDISGIGGHCSSSVLPDEE
jgi:hypothetical protein